MEKNKKKNKKKSKNTCDYTGLYSFKDSKVDVLRELYERDSYKARILYMNNTMSYTSNRVGLFEEKNGDFSLVFFTRIYGISKTNKWYSREKRMLTVTYKGGKFWVINNFRKKYVTHLCLSTIDDIPLSQRNVMLKYLASRFTWINFMIEHVVLQNVSFNTIVSKKLYSLRKALTHQYKVPYPVAKLIHKHTRSNGYHTASNLIHYLDHIKGIDNLREEWFTDNNQRCIFHDTIKMGKTLNKQVNCSWSNKRLKVEHDKWSNEISDVIFVDGNRDMLINDMFIDFNSFSGYHMLTTTKEMAVEGKRNNHCVASYISKVENGYSAIYRIGDYTLELIRKRHDRIYVLTIGQIKGYGNCSPPDYIEEGVIKTIVTYNKNVLGVELSKDFYDTNVYGTVLDDFHHVPIGEDLPF